MSIGRSWPGLMKHIFCLHHVDGRVHVHRLTGDEMVPACTMGRRQASGGSVMLWAMCCWETLGPAIYNDVNLTCTTYQSIAADHVHTFMEMVFPDGCGLFQQDNAPCLKAKMAQEWFEVLIWPPNFQVLSPIRYFGVFWTN